MLYTRIRLRQWFLSPYPERDLDFHCDVIMAIQKALHEDLFTREELSACLSYLAGYEDREKEPQIIRVLTVLCTLLHLEDEGYAKRKGGDMIKVRMMQVVPLWINYESTN